MAKLLHSWVEAQDAVIHTPAVGGQSEEQLTPRAEAALRVATATTSSAGPSGKAASSSQLCSTSRLPHGEVLVTPPPPPPPAAPASCVARSSTPTPLRPAQATVTEVRQGTSGLPLYPQLGSWMLVVLGSTDSLDSAGVPDIRRRRWSSFQFQVRFRGR